MINRIRAINIEKLKEYSLVMGYFVSLFSATCFFFDTKQEEIFGITVQLPIGLTFFPLTFAFSNIVQDKFGRITANSLICAAFIFDTFPVFGALTSFMSMPLMFYKHGLSGSILMTTMLIVTYKVFANVIITLAYGISVKK